MSELAAAQIEQLEHSDSPHLSPNQRAWRRFKRNRVAFLSLWVLLCLAIVVSVWPLLLKTLSATGAAGTSVAQQLEPDRVSDDQFRSPNSRHWFGTDVHGRDLLSRVLYGAQVSLMVGMVGACVSLVIGVLWGAIAGYCGGRTDNVMMRMVDVIYSLPSIIFVIVLITTLEGVLKAWLSFLAKNDEAFLLVNLEDLWLEAEPQNTPGTWQERPNWRRKARLSLESIRQSDTILHVLKTISDIRRRMG